MHMTGIWNRGGGINAKKGICEKGALGKLQETFMFQYDRPCL